jgi:vesicle coat complex subunit
MKLRFSTKTLIGVVAVFALVFQSYRYYLESQPPRIWLSWLKSANPAHRAMGAQEIGEMGLAAESCVQALANLVFNDPDGGVRRQAILGMISIGAKGSSQVTKEVATNAFVAAIHDPDGRRVASVAALGLWRIEADPAVAVSALIGGIRARDPWTRAASIFHLAMIVPKSRVDNATISAFSEALVDENEYVKQQGVLAFQHLIKNAPHAMSATLESHDVDVRRAAVHALIEDKPSLEAAMTGLITALRDPDAKVRSTAAMALGELGPGADIAVPSLVQALSDTDPEVRRAAVMALTQIGSTTTDKAAGLFEENLDGFNSDSSMLQSG